MGISLNDKIDQIVGGKTAGALKRAFDIVTAADLLKHYPRRYLKRGELSPIADLPLGEQVTIVAEVRQIHSRDMQQRRGNILEVVISDGEGLLTLTFFNQPWRAAPGRADSIAVGDRGLFSGKISRYQGKLQLAHPEYELFRKVTGAVVSAKTGQELDPEVWATQPVPVYPATSKLTSWQISQSVHLVLEALDEIPELLPESLRDRYGLLRYREALNQIHEPETEHQYQDARRTLAFLEAFVLQLSLLKRKQDLAVMGSPSREAAVDGFFHTMRQNIPFELTPDQLTVTVEIQQDLAGSTPMNRLLHGEVGSGKTLVALLAMLIVADSQGQSALLVPTEVLAGQHYRSLVKLLGQDLTERLQPTLLTGQMTTAERRRATLAIASGAAKIVVGTHALFAEKTQFYDLGLVVIDEQHRFGVDQREQLRMKGENPNVLVLSATPIPRTVAMTVFGDLEVSTIKTLPKKRQGITSHVVPLKTKPSWRNRIWERLVEELENGRQAFVVTPAIQPPEPGREGEVVVEAGQELLDWFEESETSIANLEETLAFLEGLEVLKPYRIAGLHGQMPSEHKDEVMRRLVANEIQVLVATTVIEVGVDVPNASLMIVLSADRFGVSQLHQLRGRIGRGEYPGLALFVTEAEPDSLAMQRLEAVASTTDGFELAELDLELRSEGDVLGSRQSGGKSSLKLLRVTRDSAMIQQAREAVEEILEQDPQLVRHQELRRLLEEINEESANYLQKN